MSILNIFLIYLSFLTYFIIWGLKNLHKDEYQFFAVIPYKKLCEDKYEGINITFYGIISALSTTISVFIFLNLIKIINFPIDKAYFILFIIFTIGIFSSKIVAYIIEHRKNTLTIGGSIFISGMIAAPVIYFIIKFFKIQELYFLPVFSILSTAYVSGEGVGRLACLSFGCCYGKPASKFNFLPGKLKVKFYADTKKAVYDSSYKNIELINIQGIVVIIFSLLGVISIISIIFQKFILAFFLSFILPSLLRFLSEFLRNDYRGNGKLSIYQIFSLILFGYGLLIVFISKNINLSLTLNSHISFYYSDIFILGFVFIVILIHSGISKVTYSNITFFLRPSKNTKVEK